MAIPIVTSLPDSALARRVWFVDIWGVMHDGVRPFTRAVAACEAFRAAGNTVILVSNAPRPALAVETQLARIGIGPNAYDAIVTSGDVSRGLVAAHAGEPILHIGPERDLPLFDGLEVVLAKGTNVGAIVCTGLVDDEREAASDYRRLLTPLASRQIPMICANPDLTVERGGRLIPCAGAVAAEYERLGGPVAYAGKPHLPIYQAAYERAEALTGQPLDKGQILAIGDGVLTDIEGAARYGIDSLYVASAVSLEGESLNNATLARLFPDTSKARPIAAMIELAG